MRTIELNLRARVLPFLAAEVAVLGHPSIWEFPNIARLEEICWEVYPPDSQVLSREKTTNSGNGGIMPILVFETAKHGNLSHFMTYGPGKSLDLNDKARLCTDVASAIAVMHTNSKHWG